MVPLIDLIYYQDKLLSKVKAFQTAQQAYISIGNRHTVQPYVEARRDLTDMIELTGTVLPLVIIDTKDASVLVLDYGRGDSIEDYVIVPAKMLTV
jgi:hypothetical protein